VGSNGGAYKVHRLDASGLVEERGDVALELSNNDRGNGLYQGYGLSVSGTIKSRATGEVPVTIKYHG